MIKNKSRKYLKPAFFCPYCGVKIYSFILLARIASNGTDAHTYYQCLKCQREFQKPLTVFI
jgi:DNA-directed RNA polymerase subunit RPC12/RpoP